MSGNHVLLAGVAYPNLETRSAAYHFFAKAKQDADRMYGKRPLCYTFSVHAVQDHIDDQIGDQGVVLQRDAGKRSQLIRDYLLPILELASVHEYNFADSTVFKSLYNAAVALFTENYEPMRVLGATAEGFNPAMLQSSRKK